jgi:DNA repair exonuclease SbcCD ATPase subunit
MAEKKVIELDLQTNLGSLKSQLKQAQADVQTLSDKFGATSQAAAEAAKKAADLKDRIQDAKALTDAFNPDAKFTSLTRSIGGALDGFQAFEGALGLIGVESEDLQKTLLKVQSAMAFSQGIQGALEAKDSFIQLGAVVKNTFSAMTTAGKAFLVGGIGLIIAAVGLIIANYDDWFGASKKVAEQQKVISEQAKEQRENIAKESGEFATLISRLKNTNEGSKERADLIKKINGQYGTTLKNIKDETKFQESLNKELASYLEYQKAKYLLQKNEEFIIKNLEKQDELRAKIAKAEKDRDKAIKDGAGQQKRTLEEGITTYVNLNEEADKALEKANETISKSNKALEAAEKRFTAYGSAANTAAKNVDKLTNSGTKYVEQTTDKVDKVEENEKKAIDLFTEGIDKLELLEKEKTKVVVGGEKERADGIKKELVGVEELRVRMWHREKELNALKKAQALEALEATADTLGQISQLFGKQTKAGKVAAIAEATIQTFLSAQKAYAATVGIPYVGPVLAPINAGLAIAAGLKNIKAITAVKVPNDTGGGGNPPTPSTGGGSIISPNFNVVGNSGINQLGQLQQKPTKAYVVSGDMTTAQALDRNRIENATLVQ